MTKAKEKFIVLFINFCWLDEEWINFEENQFERLKEKNQKHLGDHNPKIKRDLVFRNSLNEDEDEEEEDDELKGVIDQKIKKLINQNDFFYF